MLRFRASLFCDGQIAVSTVLTVCHIWIYKQMHQLEALQRESANQKVTSPWLCPSFYIVYARNPRQLI